jgi:hypothetical protein
MEEIYIGLESLNSGAALELFNAELRKVLANIEDPNTIAKVRREIALKVSFQPSEDRKMGGVRLVVTSRLAPPRGSESVVFFGRANGQPVAVQNDQNQQKLFESAPSGGVKLVKMGKE